MAKKTVSLAQSVKNGGSVPETATEQEWKDRAKAREFGKAVREGEKKYTQLCDALRAAPVELLKDSKTVAREVYMPAVLGALGLRKAPEGLVLRNLEKGTLEKRAYDLARRAVSDVRKERGISTGKAPKQGANKGAGAGKKTGKGKASDGQSKNGTTVTVTEEGALRALAGAILSRPADDNARAAYKALEEVAAFLDQELPKDAD